MANKKTMKLATAGRRFGAAVIDSIVPFIAGIVCFVVMISASLRQPSVPAWGYEYDFDDSFGYGYGYEYGYDSSGSGTALAVFGAMLILLLVYFIVQCIFFAKSQTIGKRMLGLQVVSSKDGSPIGFWMMLFRELIVKQASHVLYLGFFWILLDERNRGWHDKILDTYVVDLQGTKELEAKNAPAPQQPAAPVNPAPAPKKEAPAPKAEAPKLEEPRIEARVQEVKAAEPKPEPKAEPAQDIKVDLEVAKEAPKEAKTSVSMSMKKDELLEAAGKAGVEVSSKATKAEIIEAIEKAAK